MSEKKQFAKITSKQLETIFEGYDVLRVGFVPYETYHTEKFVVYLPVNHAHYKNTDKRFLSIVSNVNSFSESLGILLEAGHVYLTPTFVEKATHLKQNLKNIDALVGPENVHIYENRRVHSADTVDTENQLWIPPAFAPNLGRD